MYFADFMERYRDSCINNIYYYTSKRIHEIFCFQEEQHKFKTKANIKIPQHAKELLRLYRFVNFPEKKKKHHQASTKQFPKALSIIKT